MKRLMMAGVLCGLSTSLQAQYELADGPDIAPLEMFHECDVCPEMIVLPLGDFLMGGPIGDSINGIVMLNGKLTVVEIGQCHRTNPVLLYQRIYRLAHIKRMVASE